MFFVSYVLIYSDSDFRFMESKNSLYDTEYLCNVTRVKKNVTISYSLVMYGKLHVTIQ